MNANQVKQFSNYSARQIVTTTLAVVGVAAGFYMAFRFRAVFLLVFAAIILGTALRPLVKWFAQRGLPRVYALFSVYLLLSTFLGGIFFVVAPSLANQVLQLSSSLPQMYLDLRQLLLETPSRFLYRIAVSLPSNVRLIFSAAPNPAEPLQPMAQFLGIAGNIVTGLLITIALIFTTSFWILEGERTLRSLLFILPQSKRQSTYNLLESIQARLGAFVRGQLLLSVIIGVMALVAYVIIGLPNPLALALIAGIFEVIPIVGPALGAIPALLIALTLNPIYIIWVLLATVIIQGLENYLLVPRIMGSAVGVNPIITLLFLATFVKIMGLAGAILAIPMAAVLQLVLDHFVLSAGINGDSPLEGRDHFSALRYEIQELINDVRKQLREKDARSNQASDQVEDAIELLAVELDAILNEQVREELA